MLQRHIYEIIVVDHAKGTIIGDKKVIAASTESAMSKIDLPSICKEAKITTDDAEFIILNLGSLRSVQEVQETKVSNL